MVGAPGGTASSAVKTKMRHMRWEWKSLYGFSNKENIQEIADRAVIPWLQRSTKREVALPAFLDALPREQQASKRQKLTESLASLALL